MRVARMWRHPVKSFLGEKLEEAEIQADGMVGDREWGLLDLSTGHVLTGRRQPELLLASARRGPEGEPEITLPGGQTLVGPGPTTDDALSGWLGKPVSLVSARQSPAGKAEYFCDATDDASAPIEFIMPAGRFVDVMPLLVVTTASLRMGAAAHPDGVWDPVRFRPNLLIDVDEEGWMEDGWCRRALRVADVVIAPRVPCARCTIVTRPQPGLPRDLDVYRTLSRLHEGNLGVWSRVTRPGTVRVGDPVEVFDPD